jgi:hypothetical protein
VTVAVHGTIAVDKLVGIVLEIVVSDSLLLFAGDAGGIELVKTVLEPAAWTFGVELADFTVDVEVEVVVGVARSFESLDWIFTNMLTDTEEDEAAGEAEDETVVWGVDTDSEVVATGISVVELLCDAEMTAVEFEYL